MTRNVAAPLLVLALAAAVLAPPALRAQEAGSNGLDGRAMFQATTVSLSAAGEVPVRPDMATLSIGVVAQAPAAQAAMEQNRGRMNATLQALRAHGVADKDLQTGGINLNPQYTYQANQPPRLDGYQASDTVTARLYDLARVGEAIDAAVAAGSNTINGVSFGLKNPRAAEDAARVQAAQALQARAALYAQAMGLRVLRLVNLSESAGQSFAPQPRMKAMALAAEAPTPVEPGELTVRVELNALFELVR